MRNNRSIFSENKKALKINMGKINIEKALHILGCSSTSSQDEIRKAYKTRALKVHPDKNPDDPEAKQRFQELSQAYTLLVRGETDSDDEDYEDFQDDTDLLDLLRFFHFMMTQERRQRAFQAMYGSEYYGGECCCNHCLDDDDDDDIDYYVRHCGRGGGGRVGGYSFACEQGEAPPKLRGKAKKVAKSYKPQRSTARPPSQKKVNKMYNRQYQAENGRDQPTRQRRERTDRKDGGEADEDWKPFCEKPKENSAPDTRRNKPKKSEPVIPQVAPKKKSKKELLAEQRQREKEMEEIGNKLKEAALKEEEKRKKEEERKRREQEEKKKSFRHQEGMPSEVQEQLIASDRRRFEEELLLADTHSQASSQGSTGAKSKSKRRREAKQRRRVRAADDKDENKENSSMFSSVKRFPSAAPASTQPPEYDWGAEDWDAPAPNKEVPVTQEPVIKLDHVKPVTRVINKGGVKIITKVADDGEFVKQKAYFNPRQQQQRYRPQQQRQQSYNSFTAHDPVSGLSFVSSNRGQPLPSGAPNENVWSERRDFYDGAAPVTQEEEDDMLMAALRASELQAKEDELKREMYEERQTKELARREREIAEREAREHAAKKEKEIQDWPVMKPNFIHCNLPPSVLSDPVSESSSKHQRSTSFQYSQQDSHHSNDLKRNHSNQNSGFPKQPLTTNQSSHVYSCTENWEDEVEEVPVNKQNGFLEHDGVFERNGLQHGGMDRNKQELDSNLFKKSDFVEECWDEGQNEFQMEMNEGEWSSDASNGGDNEHSEFSDKTAPNGGNVDSQFESFNSAANFKHGGLISNGLDNIDEDFQDGGSYSRYGGLRRAKENESFSNDAESDEERANEMELKEKFGFKPADHGTGKRDVQGKDCDWNNNMDKKDKAMLSQFENALSLQASSLDDVDRKLPVISSASDTGLDSVDDVSLQATPRLSQSAHPLTGAAYRPPNFPVKPVNNAKVELANFTAESGNDGEHADKVALSDSVPEYQIHDNQMLNSHTELAHSTPLTHLVEPVDVNDSTSKTSRVGTVKPTMHEGAATSKEEGGTMKGLSTAPPKRLPGSGRGRSRRIAEKNPGQSTASTTTTIATPSSSTNQNPPLSTSANQNQAMAAAAATMGFPYMPMMPPPMNGFFGYSNPFAALPPHAFFPMAMPNMGPMTTDPTGNGAKSGLESGGSQQDAASEAGKAVPNMASMFAGYPMMPMLPMMGLPGAASAANLSLSFQPMHSASQGGAMDGSQNVPPSSGTGSVPHSPTSGLSKFC